MTEAPPTLAELRRVTDPAERAVAAGLYVEARQAAIREALGVRDAAIRELLPDLGATATARACKVSVSTVKLVRGKNG